MGMGSVVKIRLGTGICAKFGMGNKIWTPSPRPPSGPSSFTPNKNRSIPVEISSNVPQLSRRDVRRILGLWSILVPRIVKLLGQRADAGRDSGVVELLPQK